PGGWRGTPLGPVELRDLDPGDQGVIAEEHDLAVDELRVPAARRPVDRSPLLVGEHRAELAEHVLQLGPKGAADLGRVRHRSQGISVTGRGGRCRHLLACDSNYRARRLSAKIAGNA